MVVTAAALGCGEKPSPDALFGRWYNHRPDYADRYFELAPERVIFGTGPYTASYHMVESIERVSRAPEPVWEVQYLSDAGEPVPLRITEVAGGQLRLRLGGSRDVWRRDAPKRREEAS